MKRQKRSSAMLKKIVIMFAAVVLIVTATISGTLAWLTAETQEVTNTFTVGNIAIDLKEHDYDPTTNTLGTDITMTNTDYKIIPGAKLPKDPFVTVKKGSEECWLFVTVKAENNTVNNKTIITYSFNDTGWSSFTSDGSVSIPADTTIYYRKVEAKDTEFSDKVFYLLTDAAQNNTNGSVLVNSALTKTDMNTYYTIEEDGSFTLNNAVDLPKLTFKAYAIQSASFDTAEAAWAEVSKQAS